MWRLLFTIGGAVWTAVGVWGLAALQIHLLVEDQLAFFIWLYAGLCVLPGCLLIAAGRSLGRPRENSVQKWYRPILLGCPSCQRDLIRADECPVCGVLLSSHSTEDAWNWGDAVVQDNRLDSEGLPVGAIPLGAIPPALLSKQKKVRGQKTTAPQSLPALDVPLVSVTEPSIWKGALGHRLRVSIASIGALILFGGAWVLYSRNQPYERLVMDSTVRDSTASEALMSGGDKTGDFGSGSGHVLVQPDWTTSQMITATYGSFNIVALDLVKRFNPHIPDLGHITEGEKIWLPPIRKETLIRKQPDSSFQLVVGAFRNLADAHQLAQDVREQGYIASVTTYQVTADLAVSRVEIGELADLEAVDRAWTLANVQLVPGGT